jgi:2'-5' RNA ligase
VNGPATRRLFYALWPDPGLRDRAAGLAAGFGITQGRAVDPANYHLTLRYLGSVPATLWPGLEALGAAVAAQAQALSLRLDTVELWERPRVLVLGASRVPPALAGLVETLEAGVRHLGCPPEPRPYRPHLTLRREMRVAPERLASPGLDWDADALVLCESVGGAYPVRARWGFGPVARGAPVE